MKILHIDTGKEWRGGQRQVQFLHEGLLECGFESILVCNADGQFTKKGFPATVALKFKGEVDLSFISSLKAIIRKEKPDIIHTHDAHSLTPAVFAKLMTGGFKLINTRRVAFSINKGYFSRKKYNNSQVDRIAAISQAVKDALIDDGIPAAKISLIHSGVRFPKSIDYRMRSELREKYGLQGRFVIGNVANISPMKGHRTLIDAFVKFRAAADDAVLVLVGGGPMADEMKAYAQTTPYADSIIFTGHTDDVYEHMALFDIFCMPSLSEGLCTSIIDAMFMMLPVIASDTGGIPELVKPGFNGTLVPVKDADALSESLNELYDDAELLKRYSNNGFHTALKFSETSMVSAYIRLYEELCRRV